VRGNHPPGLDRWLAGPFDHQHFDATCQTLAAATEPDAASTGAAEVARRTLRDCDQRLACYRAALDAGADPALVAGWIAETQAQRASAEHARATTGTASIMRAAQVRAVLEELPDIVEVPADTPPTY
jgi:site-specific DNA recombinase